MKHETIIMITLIILGLLAISTVSAAENMANDVFNANNSKNAMSIDDTNNEVGVEETASVVSTENNWENVYFDASASVDGNGSIENPYKYIGYDKIKPNSNIYFKNGNYSFEYYDACSNVSFFGENPDKTIIDFNNNIVPMYNSVFIKNITFKQSTLYIYNEITASNSIFDGCYSDFNQPVIYAADFNCHMLFDDCTFMNNYNEYGGALNLDFSNVEILNCNFINNSANVGGAIYSRISNLNITNTIFNNNNANVSAGAIFYREKELFISNCTFLNNSAYSGGAIYSTYKTSNVIINDTLFTNNHAFAGGAILDFESGNIYLGNCEFINSSSDMGGALSFLGSHSNISDCNFEDNQADDGGAIYQIGGDLNILNSTFTKNNANNGGAIFIFKVDAANITNNDFIDNDGGAIVCDNENLSYSDNYFANNGVFLKFRFNLSITDGNYTLLKTIDTFNGMIPKKYDPADYGLITDARNQGDMGYCWVFGTIATLESCILKATGEKFDFSEMNVANLNSEYSYGFRHGGESWVSRAAISYLLSWFGPVDEKDDIYYSNKPLSPILNSLFHVQNVMYIIRDNISDLNPIKEAILKYGAVGADTFIDQGYFNDSSYYDPNIDEGYLEGHEFTIVGWDDNYPKENFKVTPPGDGAWIIKNSWASWHRGDGCFYMSYYNPYLGISDDSLFTFIFNDTIKFDKNYQYDFGEYLQYPFFYNSTVWYKNIYNSTDDEYLAAVSTYFYENYDWELFVYVNDEFVHTQSGRNGYGYYTINLDKYIPLKKNDTFEVIFKISALNNGNPQFPYVQYKFNDYKGKSFISSDNEHWSDLSEWWGKPIVSCIKAYTFLNKINTNITLNMDYNDYNPVNITAYLLDEYGNKIKSGNVTFELSGEKYTVNVSNGVANIVHNFNKGLNLISATFNGDGYESSSTNQSITVLKIDIEANINITTHLNTAIINVSTSPEIVSNGVVHIEDKNYIINLTKGFGSLTLNDLENKEYIIYFELENKTYECNISKNFSIKFSKTKLIVENFTTYAYSNEKYIIKLTNETSNLSGKIIRFKINNQDCIASTDVNGQAGIDINLTSGIYSISVYFSGDDKYSSNECNATITVNKIDSTLSVDDISFDYNGTGLTAISFTGATGVVAEVIDQSKAIVNVKDDAIIISGLDAGTYILSVTTISDENHNNVTKTALIVVNKLETELTSNSITTTYNINKNLVITLKDSNGNPLSGVNITVVIDSTKTLKTDNNGQIKLSTKGLLPKTYSAKISFNCNTNYEKSSKSVKVTVKKATPKLTAKAKTFKRTLKTKKYSITLKTNQNKVMKKTKVTITVNKRIYSAKTNSKGVATFKITKLTKKGTFKAVITYKGSTYYNKVTKKVNIKCK